MRAWRAVSLLVVVATAAWAVADVVARPPQGAARPNVLLVSIDSLRADHLGSYGYGRDTSPTIDDLARQGVLFETAVSSAPWTVPAHATLLTSLAPEVHGVTSVRDRLAPEAVTLAEALVGAGYDTAAFVSGPTVMAHHGFDQGFARFDESTADPRRKRSARGATSPTLVTLVDGFLRAWSDAARASGAERGGGTRRPFFVFLHMWDVHYDYDPPSPYDRMFDPDYAGDVTALDFEHNPRIVPGMDRRDLEHVIALYDGEIRFTDEHLGKILATLRALGVLDDTIVVVTADHGDGFFEHGFKGHAKTLFDEELRVPLVIRYPRRIPSGGRVPEQVRLMDVGATILGLAGVPAPPGFAGAQPRADGSAPIDLTPFVAGRRAPRPLPALPAFSHSTSFVGLQQSLRTQQAKLIRQQRSSDVPAALYLYDLAADPHERTNLVAGGTPPAAAAELEQRLGAWRDATRDRPPLAVAAQLSGTQEAQLRALGYLQ